MGLVCAAAFAQAPQIGQVSRDSVWVPTPERMIRRLLQLADTSKDDVVIDLGSGDGRIPIYAAKHFGALAIGVELERNLVELSNKTAAAEGVANRVRFLQQDLFEADISGATVVALYISPGVMERLRPRLLALKPGTRVVSHHFTLGDWQPDEVIQVEGRTGYLWVGPAAVAGGWRVSISRKSLYLAAFAYASRSTIRRSRRQANARENRCTSSARACAAPKFASPRSIRTARRVTSKAAWRALA